MWPNPAADGISMAVVIVNRETTSSNLKIYTSDDFGLTWVLRYTDAETEEDNMIQLHMGTVSGSKLVGLRHPVLSGEEAALAVVISLDSGNTWTVTALSGIPGGTQLSSDWAAVYSVVADVILAQHPRASDWRILRIKNVLIGGLTWEDITTDLTDAATGMHWKGVHLIP